MKRDSMMKLILQHADEINVLHSAIDETYKHKKTDENAWRQATQKFHALYDKLAFPGGLEKGLALLKEYDPSIIELAIIYLEADPYYFRSGYIKEKLAHILKNAPLSDEQKQRLYSVLLASVHGYQDQRKFRAYCALAIAIADDTFKTSLENAVAKASDEKVKEFLLIMRDKIQKHT